ncbi:MAG: hypothetical protein ABI554_13815, partial [Flavobacterium sp.]
SRKENRQSLSSYECDLLHLFAIARISSVEIDILNENIVMKMIAIAPDRSENPFVAGFATKD